MSNRYRNIEYNVRHMDDGTWEWFIASLNFGGRTANEASAIEACKKSIDKWRESPN